MRIKHKTVTIMGRKKSGKSNLLHYLLRRKERYRNHLIFDTMREHRGLNRYIPDYKRGKELRKEFDAFAKSMVFETERKKRPEFLCIEELNRIAPNRKTPPESINDCIDEPRHYDIGVIGITRRPSQVNTDFIELSDYLLVFHLSGKNDIKRLNDEADGLGDATKGLGDKDYHFLLVPPNRENWKLMSPVKDVKPNEAGFL